jgi:uncharacterized protein YraI
MSTTQQYDQTATTCPPCRGVTPGHGSIPTYKTKVLKVDGQEVTLEYCVEDKVVCDISIVTPLMTVRLSDGLTIDCEQGQVFVNSDVTDAVMSFAKVNGLELGF